MEWKGSPLNVCATEVNDLKLCGFLSRGEQMLLFVIRLTDFACWTIKWAKNPIFFGLVCWI